MLDFFFGEIVNKSSIDELVGLLSVSRVTAGAHFHVLVGALHNFPVVTTEICGGRKFRENFEAQNQHPKFSEIFDPTTG
jgi:hypothetical protein